jgi:hypothetical protein
MHTKTQIKKNRAESEKNSFSILKKKNRKKEKKKHSSFFFHCFFVF